MGIGIRGTGRWRTGKEFVRVTKYLGSTRKLSVNDSLCRMRVSVEPLSVRELEVLSLIARGGSNQEIARELVIAVGTVKTHLNKIYGKLEVHSRTQALVRARELNML